MENNLLVVGDLSGMILAELFNKIQKEFGDKFCYCSESAWSMCDEPEWEKKFNVIWATKSALKTSSKLRKMANAKNNVYVLDSNGALKPHKLVHSRNKTPNKKTKSNNFSF